MKEPKYKTLARTRAKARVLGEELWVAPHLHNFKIPSALEGIVLQAEVLLKESPTGRVLLVADRISVGERLPFPVPEKPEGEQEGG
ncbi:MAG: hypothetical protein QXT45_07475 [Candidatus Bilamarchaeaceae archaeon]